MDISFLSKININKIFPKAIKRDKIVLPDDTKSIGMGTFSNFENLKEITLNNGLKKIGHKAFENAGIEKVIVPPTVCNFGNLVFNDCKNLKKATFLGEINKIPTGTFEGCQNLEAVDFPFEVESIGPLAFCRCSSLKYLELPSSVKEIEGSAFKHSGLKMIVTSSDINIKPMAFAGTNLVYVYKMNGKNNYIFSEKPINFLDVTLLADFSKLKYLKDFDIINPILFENNKEIGDFIEKINKEKVFFPFEMMIEEFEKNKNFDKYQTFKWLKLLSKDIDFSKLSISQLRGLCGFGKAMGLFSKPIKESRISKSGKEISEVVDYGQKTYEFLRMCVEKKLLNFESETSSLDGIKSDFNPNLAKFLLNQDNFALMLDENNKSFDFIKRVCNEFDEVQKYNRSNNAQARRLAPTVKKFVEYFDLNHFKGVRTEDLPIAQEVGKHFSEQKDFDAAKQIFDIARKNHVPRGILKKNRRECFAHYNIIREAALAKGNEKEISRLDELLNGKFRYEWIDKYDARNLTLGKYCSCCAHLEGVGFGIMSAGIISPDCQNLIFTNENGDIIGKSTLFVNREKGYGIFNNVEINEDIEMSKRETIYKKYKDAVRKFALQYNKENPDKPLKKINVGFDHNDLNYYIIKEHKLESENKLLVAPDYGQFSLPGHGRYSGDSSMRQYTMWTIEEERER